ncbi:cystathionine beta-lyase [Methylobacterium sp. Leaf399]|uniref:c-type cytochrome n=1 Tax=unclassified Methylobacterium TaxID=2615210 RepID=UPI0006F766E7|nr:MULTISPECIES: cytochrome c family protein [unclassified Methylobacterium]KQP50856.1 cystathionine beta-lyase [Methylobacterium sp. Leaf108]KQT07837.1 cystathionine beta-lyase [Methylobacterium sp. Leaf399]KQT88952.1 cystathionine beta-lyase [Methylobacterium sp. Leaf466]
MRHLLLNLAVLLALPVAAQAQDAGDPAAGEKAFTACKACHQVGKNGVGPNLVGVVGRKAASYDGYTYSAALKAADITWDDANLHAWLKNPKAKVPGTKMIFAGYPDDKKIDDVIAYLKTLK